MVRTLMKSSKYKPVLLAGFLLFSSCSANLQWYIRNLSEKEVTLTLFYNNQKQNSIKSLYPLNIKYVPFCHSIIKIDKNTSKFLDDSLQLIMVDSLRFRVIIPKQSTVNLSSIIPTNFGNKESVWLELRQEEPIYLIDTKSALDKQKPFKTTGGSILNNLIYFDFEN